MKAAIFAACVVFATVALANSQSPADNLVQFLEHRLERAQENQIPAVAESAKHLMQIVGSNEFKDMVHLVVESIGQMGQMYVKFVNGAADGLCELKDKEDGATIEDVKNMLEGISVE